MTQGSQCYTVYHKRDFYKDTVQTITLSQLPTSQLETQRKQFRHYLETENLNKGVVCLHHTRTYFVSSLCDVHVFEFDIRIDL